MKKIKVFLGGYINQTNAQNLSCLELAKHLDKERFEVFTLAINHGNLGKIDSRSFNLFNCRYPVKITSLIGFIWGIFNCDIAYLPRGNNYKYSRFLLKVFKRKSFKQIERLIDKDAPEKFSYLFKNTEELKANYFYTTKTFAISKFMRDYTIEHFQFPLQNEVLELTVNVDDFRSIHKVKTELKEVVLIGNDLIRKGINDYLHLAKIFPSLHFHVIGRDEKGIIESYKQEFHLNNVTHHGLLKPVEMIKVLERVDLHLLLSTSEGFGKVTIECAAAGIPSIVYNTYGAEEWIDNTVNGLIKSNVNEVEEAIHMLIEQPKILSNLSVNCEKMPERFLPENLTRKYEKVIEDLYRSN